MRLLSHKRRCPQRSTAAGFTLAEAAITIAIVGLTLAYTMQALQSAQITAAHSRNVKVARELGMLTLSEIATGRWWDDIDTERGGTYAEQEYHDFYYELAVGDESFPDDDSHDDYYDGIKHDNWRYREEQANNDIDFDEDEEAAQAFEKIQVQVTFPQLSDLLENKITLERWIPWEQVYGVDEDLEAGTSEDSPDGESFSPPDGESE
ncbi:MAG: hypothetical protein ACI8QC_000481 [Planctomycetota bacterium]|jgi:hypothetical protein